ncbi:MAG TPA: TetR/AcrR family transcriptional regulator [Bradyrhizobium sp.]|nr:TetR/AcrR family transcriptional regulator [Bradyrhizobium sp.]
MRKTHAARGRAKPRTREQHEPLRQRVMDAAFAVFLDKGFAAASTLDIASRANISKRDLYQVAASKSELLRQAMAERTGKMRPPSELPVAASREALTATLAAFGLGVLNGVCDRTMLALYRFAAVEAESAPDVARMLVALGRDAGRAALSRALARAQADGFIRAGDPATQAGDFIALLWGDLLLRLVMRLAEPPPHAVLERRAQEATEKLLALYAI